MMMILSVVELPNWRPQIDCFKLAVVMLHKLRFFCLNLHQELTMPFGVTMSFFWLSPLFVGHR